MELKLPIYTDEFCTEVERVATADDFKLSVGICEDVLDLVNIDMFSGGLDALSDESKIQLAIGIVTGGFPLFKRIMKGLFKLSDDDVRKTDVSDVAVVVVKIVEYSISMLSGSLGGESSKN